MKTKPATERYNGNHNGFLIPLSQSRGSPPGVSHPLNQNAVSKLNGLKEFHVEDGGNDGNGVIFRNRGHVSLNDNDLVQLSIVNQSSTVLDIFREYD